MEQFKNIRRVDLETGEPAAFSVRQLYYADKKANRIGAMVYANGDPVALTGTCSGTAIRADGTTVPMTGAISGNTAYVDLIQDCYAIEGEIRIFVKITSGNVTATLAAAVGNVRLTETNAVIDPGTIIPSVSALISAIDDAVASIPADYSALLAAIAPDYADLTFPVKKGTFCWHSGTLYTAKRDIDTSESWTASHWVSSSLANELSWRVDDVKSALIQTNDNIGGKFGGWVVGHVTSSGFSTDSKYGMSNVIHAPAGSKLIVDGGGYYFNVFALTKVGDSGVVTSDYAYSSTLVSGYLSNPVDMVIENETYLIIDCRNKASYTASTNIDVSAIPIVANLYAGLVLDAYNAPIPDNSVTKEKTTFWVHEKSANLFNPADSGNIVRGKYVNTSDGALNGNANYFVAYTKLEGPGDYALIVNTALYGTTNAKAIHFYDADKTYISKIDGTYLDTTVTDRPLKVTVTQSVINSGAVYIGWTGKISQINDLMFVKASTYPSTYESYVDIWTMPGLPYNENPLFGQFASFNGDSICYGAGYTGGYGAIISSENSMKYQNIGVAGGTITSGTTYAGGGNRYWINEHISDMDEDADYAIVEGGVNDSSLQVTLGEITEDYNSALDTTTFYGAMESICKQLTVRYKGKKYGFIIVHQMSRGLRPGGAYHQAVIECCSKWGVPCLDLSTQIPPFGFFTSASESLYALRTECTKDGDGWHPNEEGYRKYYVDKITAWMKTL